MTRPRIQNQRTYTKVDLEQTEIIVICYTVYQIERRECICTGNCTREISDDNILCTEIMRQNMYYAYASFISLFMLIFITADLLYWPLYIRYAGIIKM